MEIVRNREGYEVSFVREGEPDPSWIAAFAEEGGTAIVSGDYNILQHWPNLIAYTESGLISFFPPKAFHQLSGFGRAAYFIRWWPAIIEKTKASSRGDRWRLPMNWREIDHSKMEPLKDPRVDEPTLQDPDKVQTIQDTLRFSEAADRMAKRPD